MALASIMLGSFVGFLSAITGFAMFDLHIWQSLLLYATSGTLVAVFAIFALLLRNQTSVGPERHSDKHATATI